MAPIMFAKAWREDVDRRLGTDPQYASDLYGLLTRLNDRTAPPAALDHVVSQPWRQARRDWYDAAGLIEVGLHLQAGWCVTAKITLGAEPGPDRDTDGNNAKLQALRPRFGASFIGGRGDNDGRVSWSEPLDIAHDMGEGHQLVVRYPPSDIPLEVGRAEPDTTLWHLRTEGGVARWPYQSPHLTLLLSTCSITGQPIPLGPPTVIAGQRRLPPPPPRTDPEFDAS